MLLVWSLAVLGAEGLLSEGWSHPSSEVSASLPVVGAENVNLAAQQLVRATPVAAMFDLDGTVWPFALDKPPYVGGASGIYKRGEALGTFETDDGQEVALLGDVREIILALHDAGVPVIISSHNSKPEWSWNALNNIHLREGLTIAQVVQKTDPDLELSKIKKGMRKHEHVLKIARHFSSRNIIFFDDRADIIRDIRKEGFPGATHIFNGCYDHPDGCNHCLSQGVKHEHFRMATTLALAGLQPVSELELSESEKLVRSKTLRETSDRLLSAPEKKLRVRSATLYKAYNL